MARFMASRTRASSSGLAFGLAVSKKVANCRRLGTDRSLSPLFPSTRAAAECGTLGAMSTSPASSAATRAASSGMMR